MEHLVHHKAQRFKENLMQHKAPHKLAQGRAASARKVRESTAKVKESTGNGKESVGQVKNPLEKQRNPWEKLKPQTTDSL